MKLRTLLLCACLGALAYTGCDLGSPLNDGPGSGTEGEGLRGQLLRPDGSPAAGAWVRAYPVENAAVLGKRAAAAADSALTGGDGRFAFTTLAHGIYNLESSVQFNGATVSILIRAVAYAGKTDLGPDTLKATGSVTLQVQSLGAALKDAQCFIAATPFRGASDDSGTCTIAGMPPGVFSIEITYNGNTVSASGDLQVVAGIISQGGSVDVGDGSGLSPHPVELTLAAISTRRIGDTLAGGSPAPTPLEKVVVLFTSSAGDTVRDTLTTGTVPALNPSAADSQTLRKTYALASLRFWKMNVKAYDARGRATHDSSGYGQKLRLAAHFRRYALGLTLPDSLVSVSLTGPRWGVRLARLSLKINGAAALDSASPSFFPPNVALGFAYDYADPSPNQTVEVSVYGSVAGSFPVAADPAQPLFRGTMVFTPASTPLPLALAWAGPTKPAAPALSTPSAGAASVPVTYALGWDTVAWAASYHLQLATDSLFTALIVNDSTLTGALRVVGPLTAGTKYFWRVSAGNALGAGDYSPVRTFRTAAPGSSRFALTASTVALWNFASHASATTFADLSPNAFTLTAGGAVALAASPNDSALDLTAENQYLTTPNELVLTAGATGQLTYEARVYLTQYPSESNFNHEFTVMGMYEGLKMQITSDGRLLCSGQKSDAWYAPSSAVGIVPLNRWVDLAIAIDNSTGQAYAYIDGQPIQLYGTVNADPYRVSTSPFAVGRDLMDDQQLLGKIEEIRVSGDLALGAGLPLSSGNP